MLSGILLLRSLRISTRGRVMQEELEDENDLSNGTTQLELGTPPAFLPPSLLLLLLHAIIKTPPSLLRAQIPAPTSWVRSRTSPAREKTGTDFGSKALVLLVCKAIRKSTGNNNNSNTESLSLSKIQSLGWTGRCKDDRSMVQILTKLRDVSTKITPFFF